jgi:uncharacterized protein YbcC (UPF0753/DUF2309 family)
MIQSTEPINYFDWAQVIDDLKHQLPAQAPLKDFIHHNTLHAFQHMPFQHGIRKASKRFGYRVLLPLKEYRQAYHTNRINHDVLTRVVREEKGSANVTGWLDKLINHAYEAPEPPRIGLLRGLWKRNYKIDLDSLVHPLLFRLVSSYLDQGISTWSFPVADKGFLVALRQLELESAVSLFRTRRGRDTFMNRQLTIDNLLSQLVGCSSKYAQYLFDQQFAHQGWSGMVATVEQQPETLLDKRDIKLEDFIFLELVLEIDALEYVLGKNWKALTKEWVKLVPNLFEEDPVSEFEEVLFLWHLAYEWCYYDTLLGGIRTPNSQLRESKTHSFQAIFCIDDRECSLRRYLENEDPSCYTYGSPGYFGVEFYFQPVDGKFMMKLCPAPVHPNYLVKEVSSDAKRLKDYHLGKEAHSMHGGWLISQTLGFWSALKLAVNVFNPKFQPGSSSSFSHMSKSSELQIERVTESKVGNLLQGFSINEMASRVETTLRGIGLVDNFAPLIYLVGHGASSTNNPHYAAYDCGACSGRAGSVNARVFSAMANNKRVRDVLKTHNIHIPDSTCFVGALHDTTRDEIEFFDEHVLSGESIHNHNKYANTFRSALIKNARERSRRFINVDSTASDQNLHDRVKLRSVMLFEPRPELNHATNAACVVGRRDLTSHLFLDRRAFMNSYNYQIDPQGDYLLPILRAVAPVCGGINLEYFFSRVDNHKLGAGSKLPHNVMGLFAVANGIDGDLRPGLPSQMIEVHEPIRLMVVVEHFEDVILSVIQRDIPTYEWFKNEWVRLAAVHPETREISIFRDEKFQPYNPMYAPPFVKNIDEYILKHTDNIPVLKIA